ncbi:MAG: ABC transporter substrate-binding protein [Marinibacterium sp.]|nr:ABC transporter substrate-binding protein [Marinibacterium sp.]
MSRAILILIATVAVLSGAAWFLYQLRTDVTVIGILHPSKVHSPAVTGFKEQMQEYGYVEGSTVTYLYDGPAGSGKELSHRAKELVEQGATLKFTASTPATKTALAAAEGTDIQIIFGPVNDPVGAGIVDSLRRPGGNATGVTLAPSTARRLAWFKEIDSTATRILVPYNPRDRSSMTSFSRVNAASASLGLKIIASEVENLDDVRALFSALPEDIDGVFLPRDSMITSAIQDIVAATIDRQLILSGPGFSQVMRGALYAYGVRQPSVGRTAARLANEVFSGADPAVIPVEEEQSNLFINTETAKQIGLTLSPSLLSQAKALLP